MSKGELIDDHVSLQQCSKAVNALHSHEVKKTQKYEQDQLLPAKEQHIWLNVTVKTIPTGHKLKPVKIPIVHPLVDPRTTPVCLITKDPQREYKDLLEKHNIKFISRVVGLEKLKGKFKPFEARRILLKENGLFLADDRIIPLLPKLLGSKWFEAKKQPMPVCLTRKDLKGELERAISSTYMNQNQGTCTSIKIGKTSQTPSQILDNIKTAIPSIVKAIKGNWDNIQSLNIKTNSSASLPIWSCNLDNAEGGRWHGLGEDALGEDSEGEDSEEETTKQTRSATSKGKKRPSSSDEEEEEAEKPTKKSKSADGSAASKAKTPSTATKPTPAAAASPVASKKRKASKDAEMPAKAVTPSVTPTPAGKKAKAAAALSAPAAAAAAPAESASTASVSASAGKKQKKPEGAASTRELRSAKPASVESASAKTSPSVPDAAVASSGKAAKEKKKTSKVPEAAPSESPAASVKAVKPSLSKEEMKQKRSAGAGEKKKEIVHKAKGGKSAKNAVLGKKVAQE